LSPLGVRGATGPASAVASLVGRVPTQTLAPTYELLRHRLADGELTTVYVVRHPKADTRLSIEHFAVPQRLDRWCERSDVHEAIVGGFFLRPHGPALGELWIGGRRIETEHVLDPYTQARAAISIDEHEIRIGPRAELPPRPAGHLLQAGPMLVREGAPLCDPHDAEGFVAGARQFDSDITSGRDPRAVLATSDDELIALVCDGRRTGVDAGLTLTELAELTAGLGARQAINLDGGGSTALIHRGHLLNRPYDDQDRPSRGLRPVATAVIFHPAATPALDGEAVRADSQRRRAPPRRPAASGRGRGGAP
jgi:Phosphodiester glycosidase